MNRAPCLLAGLIATCLLVPPAFPQSGTVTVPETRRVDHFDTYHGTSVADPYRWLEANAKEDASVREWVSQQNEATFEYLEQIPQRDAIRKRLTQLWDYEKLTAPRKISGGYAYLKNDGLQNHSVLYITKSWEETPRALIDPNQWSADGTVALSGTSFSPDGQLVAYAIADAGSDWRTWKIRQVGSGEDLSDELKWIKFSSVSWTPDSRGFFYSRYDAPDPGAEFQTVNRFQKLYYHRVGTPQSQDVLVYKNDQEPLWGFGPTVTEDGRYLVITVWKGTADRYRVMVKDLHEPYGMPMDLIDNFEAEYTLIGNDGPLLFFKTDLDAPMGRVIAIDLNWPEPEHWHEIIPESQDTLRSVSLVGNLFLASYLADAKTATVVYRMNGQMLREVPFPGIGTASGFGGKRTHTETFFTFSSFATPPSLYRYDLISGQSEKIQQSEVDFDPEDYEVKQVFYTSRDGTQVPMFICHRRGIALDSNNPTLLYGYGGFNIPLTPTFSITRLAWLEMGGVLAVANLRGGGEYGERWHEAGTKLKKQNVFDDFIAAAIWLQENGYTRPEKLGIQGGSNGGLLVGACMTQRPELFGACLPAVGVMDMLRFHEFTIGWAWVDDYGSSEDPEEFAALLKYSPLHNTKPGIEYPPTLVTTGDTDDRVVPGHSFKFAAALQYAQAGDAPILIRVETRAGHGAGKPTAMRIEEAADVWAFLSQNLGLKR